jgi:hypothetical protein
VSESDIPEPIAGPFQRIKLAPGVLGYTMYVCGLVVIAIIVAMIVRPDLVPWALGLAVIIVGGFMWFAGWFGSKFPGPALLGGANLVKNLETVAAQGRIIDATAVPVPNPALPPPDASEGNPDAA